MRLIALIGVLGIAAASHPYPAQHEGAGKEPTAGRGVFAGTPFVPHSAVVDYEVGLSCCPSQTVGTVVLYLFERPGVTCTTLEAAKSKRFFTYSVETDGKKLPVGRAAPSSFFQQASFNVVGLTTGFQLGIRIVYSRIDATAGALWHGSVSAPRSSLKGKLYSFAGTFAARWCGTKNG